MLEHLLTSDKQSLAFQLVVAFRDVMSIAKKTDIKPTYETAIKLIHELSPELYDEIVLELPFKNLSDQAKFYQEKAALISATDSNTTPIQLVQADINELEELLERSEDIDVENSNLVRQRILSLEAIKVSLKPRKASENRYLQRDFSRVDRTDFGASFLQADDFVADYKLKKGTYLRLRLLHPDNIEHITGADLIYEQHNETSDRFRVMFLQYKIWEDGVLYFSQARNLEPQLRKMKNILCNQGYCDDPASLANQFNYRFPYCSAFLRPTDKIQLSQEKMLSSGIHIPVCLALEWKDEGQLSIDKKQIRTSTLTHNIFEHLFNRGFIGSRWLTKDELTKLYTDNQVLEPDETIKIYAREMIENRS